MPRATKKVATSDNVLDFKPRQSIFVPEGTHSKNVVTMILASNRFANFGLIDGDLLILDIERKPQTGEIFAFDSPSDDTAKDIDIYFEPKDGGKPVIGTVIGFQRFTVADAVERKNRKVA